MGKFVGGCSGRMLIRIPEGRKAGTEWPLLHEHGKELGPPPSPGRGQSRRPMIRHQRDLRFGRVRLFERALALAGVAFLPGAFLFAGVARRAGG